MTAFWLCVIFVLLGIFLETTNSQAKSGPYKLILYRVANCADKGSGEVSIKSTAREGEDGEIYHSGELNLPHGLDDDNFKASGDASIKNRNGQWEPIGLVWKMGFPKACSSTKQMVPVWFDILKAAGVQSPECPVAKGEYQVKDYYVGPTLKDIKKLKYGTYRVRFHFIRGGKEIGCIAYFARVIPSSA